MSKDKISDYSSTANSNTDIAGINIDEGCAPSGINDAIRTLMSQLKNFQTGASGDAVTVGGVLTVKGASINDTNDNELFKLTATSSAVNEFTIANAATGASPTISASGGDTNIGINLSPKGTGGVVFPAGAVATPSVTTSGDLNTGIYFPAADTVAVTTGGTERVRVNSSGNVGVGVTPSYVLDTFDSTGQIRIARNKTTTGDMGGLLLTGLNGSSSAVSYALIQSNASTITAGSEAGNLDFYTMRSGSLTQAARIEPSGTLSISRSVGTSFQAVGVYNETSANAANVYVASSGYFYRATSSLKYKKDVQDATHGLTELLTLRSVTYKGKNQADGEAVFGGLIAEEVHEAGLTEFVQYADDGTPDALAYGNMVSLCIKAIQEQQAIITQLTARIEALENN